MKAKYFKKEEEKTQDDKNEGNIELNRGKKR
jgi:hypothetical protein